MERREFITLLGGVAVTWPVAANAQQALKSRPTIGFLGTNTPSAQEQWTVAFVQRLHELGWIEGQTVEIQYRWGEGRTERFTALATELVRHCHDGGRCPRGQAGDIHHPDCLCGGDGPGWQWLCGKPGAARRQCYRPIGPTERSCW